MTEREEFSYGMDDTNSFIKDTAIALHFYEV